MQTATEKAISELKGIGYTDEKIREMLTLLLPDVADQLLLDLAGQCTDQEIDDFEKQLNDIKDSKEFEKALEDMAEKAYGDKARERMDATMAELLDELRELTLKIRETYQKYMSGDQKTRKDVDGFMNSEEYKQMQKDMEEDGFDFLAEAVK